MPHVSRLALAVRVSATGSALTAPCLAGPTRQRDISTTGRARNCGRAPQIEPPLFVGPQTKPIIWGKISNCGGRREIKEIICPDFSPPPIPTRRRRPGLAGTLPEVSPPAVCPRISFISSKISRPRPNPPPRRFGPSSPGFAAGSLPARRIPARACSELGSEGRFREPCR